MFFVRSLTLFFSLLLVLPLQAAEIARTIKWDNLIPQMPPIENPFTGLSMDQRTDFEVLVGIRDMKRRGFLSEVNETSDDETEIRKRLTRQGLSVPNYMVEYEHLEKEIIKRKSQTQRAKGKENTITRQKMMPQIDSK